MKVKRGSPTLKSAASIFSNQRGVKNCGHGKEAFSTM